MEFKVSMVRLRPQLMIPPPPESIVPPQGGTETVFGSFLSLGGSVWADSFCNESEISCIKFRHTTKGIPAEKMFDPPFRGGTDTVFWSFLRRGSSDQADSFCNESEISCRSFRHPTKGMGKKLVFQKKVSRFMFLLFLS